MPSASLPAFRESLANYPVLDEEDYSEREWQATLENFAIEMWPYRNDLPEGWEGRGLFLVQRQQRQGPLHRETETTKAATPHETQSSRL